MYIKTCKIIFLLTLAFLFLSISRQADASTLIDSDIPTSTTWTSAGNPYIIADSISIQAGATLTIEPGVHIKVEDGVLVAVDGTIQANGTSIEPIIITSFHDDSVGGDDNGDVDATIAQAGDYVGFSFSPTGEGAFIYTTITYADTALYADNTNLTITNGSFSFLNIGIQTIGGTLMLTNTSFSENYIPTKIDFVTVLTHSGNSFTNNSYNALGLYGDPVLQNLHITTGTYVLFGVLNLFNSDLTLDPGVILKPAYQNISISINGTVSAVGTSVLPIIITSFDDDSAGGDTNNDGPSTASNNGFAGIDIISNPNEISTVDYLVVKNLGFGGIYIEDGTLIISNSEFTGIYSGISVFGGTLTISDSSFHDLTSEAVVVFMDGTINITNTNFENIQDIDAIAVYNQSTAFIDHVNISTQVQYSPLQTGATVFNDSSLDIDHTTIDGVPTGIEVFNNSTLDANHMTVKNADTGIAGFEGQGYSSTFIKLKNSEITQNNFGIDIYTAISVDISDNSIHDNQTGAENLYPLSLSMSNNWWGSETGPTHASNPTGTGDVVSDYISYSPFLTVDPLNPIPPTPLTYFAKVTNAPGNIGEMRENPSSSGVLIKTLPNDWVVQVIEKTNAGAPMIANGFRWYKVKDRTDDSVGYMIAGPAINPTATNLPYVANQQTNFQDISATQLTTKTARANKIIEAVDHYWGNTSSSASIYSSDDHSNLKISKFNQDGFPVELVMAIVAQESSSVNYNNEHVSFDYGHGIMQNTFDALKNEPNEFGKNKNDPRGLLSDVVISKCIELHSSEYKKCYKNTDTKLLKPYDNYDHNLSNPKYKQYSNTNQSIYANMKDGLGVLRQKYGHVYQNTCTGSVVMGPYTFTCDDIKRIKAVWGYNGAVLDPNVNYLKLISQKLAALDTYFPGHTYANTDQLIEKLAYANDHRKEIKVHSPVELTVKDSLGNVTGISNTTITNDIPNSYYDPEAETALILFPDDSYTYKVVGDVVGGTYGFEVNNGDDVLGSETIFQATTIPIQTGEVHTYHIDETILANGGNGTTLDIDIDGDGTPEQTIVTGATLDMTDPIIDTTKILPIYDLGKKIDLSKIITDDISDFADIVVTASLDGVPLVMIANTIQLNVIGDRTLSITATDQAGNAVVQNFPIHINYIFGGFKPVSQSVSINLGAQIKTQFVLKGLGGVTPIPTAHPTVIFRRVSDNHTVIPSCNATQTCFKKVNNQYTFNKLASTKGGIGLGIWEIKVTIDDGNEYIKTIDVIN